MKSENRMNLIISSVPQNSIEISAFWVRRWKVEYLCQLIDEKFDDMMIPVRKLKRM